MEGPDELRVRRAFDDVQLKEPPMGFHAGDVIFGGQQHQLRTRRHRRMAFALVIAAAVVPVGLLRLPISGDDLGPVTQPSPISTATSTQTGTPSNTHQPTTPSAAPTSSSTPEGIRKFPYWAADSEALLVLPTTGLSNISGIGAPGYNIRSGPGDTFPIVGSTGDTTFAVSDVPIQIECAVIDEDFVVGVEMELWVRLITPSPGNYTAGALTADAPVPRCPD